MSVLAWMKSLLGHGLGRAADVSAAAQSAFDAGLAAFAGRDFAGAIAAFERAVAWDDGNADAHNNLGLAYLEAGRSADAADAFAVALELRPQFPQAHYNTALAALARDEVERAVTALRQAIRIWPDYAAAHNALGYLLSHRTGEFAEGAAHIRRALDLAPEDRDVRCNYSAILVQEGHAHDAIRVCDEIGRAHV